MSCRWVGMLAANNSIDEVTNEMIYCSNTLLYVVHCRTFYSKNIRHCLQRTGLCDVGEFEKRPPGTAAQ